MQGILVKMRFIALFSFSIGFEVNRGSGMCQKIAQIIQRHAMVMGRSCQNVRSIYMSEHSDKQMVWNLSLSHTLSLSQALFTTDSDFIAWGCWHGFLCIILLYHCMWAESIILNIINTYSNITFSVLPSHDYSISQETDHVSSTVYHW